MFGRAARAPAGCSGPGCSRSSASDSLIVVDPLLDHVCLLVELGVERRRSRGSCSVFSDSLKSLSNRGRSSPASRRAARGTPPAAAIASSSSVVSVGYLRRKSAIARVGARARPASQSAGECRRWRPRCSSARSGSPRRATASRPVARCRSRSAAADRSTAAGRGSARTCASGRSVPRARCARRLAPASVERADARSLLAASPLGVRSDLRDGRCSSATRARRSSRDGLASRAAPRSSAASCRAEACQSSRATSPALVAAGQGVAARRRPASRVLALG